MPPSVLPKEKYSRRLRHARDRGVDVPLSPSFSVFLSPFSPTSSSPSWIRLDRSHHPIRRLQLREGPTEEGFMKVGHFQSSFSSLRTVYAFRLSPRFISVPHFCFLYPFVPHFPPNMLRNVILERKSGRSIEVLQNTHCSNYSLSCANNARVCHYPLSCANNLRVCNGFPDA